jgi:hypothetical protein
VGSKICRTRISTANLICFSSSLRFTRKRKRAKSGTGSASKSISALVQLVSSQRWSSPCAAHPPVWKVQVHPCPHYFNAGYPRSNSPPQHVGQTESPSHAHSRKHRSTPQHNSATEWMNRINNFKKTTWNGTCISNYKGIWEYKN